LPTPTVTMTASPIASPGGNIAAASPVNVIVKAGQTDIDAGSFTYTDTESGETVEEISSVTVTVSNPSVLSSLTLTATEGEVSESDTETPTSTTVFTFGEPIEVFAGDTVNFSLTAVIAGGSSSPTKPMVLSFGTKPIGGGGGGGGGMHIQSLLATLPDASSSHGVMMMVGTIAAMLLMLALPAGMRPRMLTASIALMAVAMGLTVTMSACDPCPACTTAHLTTTDQTVTSAAVTSGEDVPIDISGVPALLSQLSE